MANTCYLILYEIKSDLVIISKIFVHLFKFLLFLLNTKEDTSLHKLCHFLPYHQTFSSHFTLNSTSIFLIKKRKRKKKRKVRMEEVWCCHGHAIVIVDCLNGCTKRIFLEESFNLYLILGNFLNIYIYI